MSSGLYFMGFLLFSERNINWCFAENLSLNSFLYPSPAVHSHATLSLCKWFTLIPVLYFGINRETIKALASNPWYLLVGISEWSTDLLLSIWHLCSPLWPCWLCSPVGYVKRKPFCSELVWPLTADSTDLCLLWATESSLESGPGQRCVLTSSLLLASVSG